MKPTQGRAWSRPKTLRTNARAEREKLTSSLPNLIILMDSMQHRTTRPLELPSRDLAFEFASHLMSIGARRGMTISANRIAMLANGRPSMQSAARLALLILGLALGAEIVPAMAQSASSGLSTYKNGYSGSGLSGLESPVNVSTRDANGNLVVTNGVIQTASSSSIFSQSGGAGYSATGVGASVGGGATAIGNNLTVTVSGDNNTVIVKATQTNTGAITATDTVLNGKVNLNAGQ